MTPKERATMQQALEALREYRDTQMIQAPRRAITALREVLAEQAEQDLDTCPGCGGVADNGHDREFPPNPYYCTKCTEQAEQEPVHWVVPDFGFLFPSEDAAKRYLANIESDAKPTPCCAAPVRTKDLTDDEINELWLTHGQGQMMYIHENFARAVIAADREKNRGTA